ncbi:MAG TPA: MFS transporter [Bryobacteraceae bacterium]|nr:MFS transporter [Bryobacteraceae bacterium]
MPAGPVDFRAYVRLLRGNRNFRLLWLAQLVSEIGDWLYAVAIYSLVLEVTGSAQAVAFAFVLQVLPQFFVSPACGVLNDRLSRRRLMILADWARAAIVFLMLFVQTREALPLLFVLLFAETLFWALFEPGRNAIIPNITRSPEETLVANGLSATTWSFALAAGSAIGGVLAAVFGRNAVFVINSCTFIASALLLRAMQVREPHVENIASFRVRDIFDFTPVLEGLRYVRRDPRLTATLFVKSGIGFLGANWVLLPILGERVYPLHVAGMDPKSAGMLGMSMLMGCRGIGALAGPLVATRWSGNDERRFRIGITAGFVAAGLGYLTVGWSGTLLGACVGVALAHAGGSTCWVYSTTMLQAYTEDKLRGRVFSTEFAFHMLVLSLSTYTAGVLADSGVSVSTLATLRGTAVLVPGVGWVIAQRLWR